MTCGEYRCALRVCTSLLGVAIAMPVAAQTPSDPLRDLVRSAGLGSGYAQMLNLVATPDISAASYRIDSGTSDPTLDVVRVPYRSRWRALSPDADLWWRLSGGYLRLKDDQPFTLLSPNDGSVATRWSAYSVAGGLFARVRVGEGLTLVPALDFAVAQLDNKASYSGTAVLLKPLLDGLAFNWRTNAWLATPGVALEWSPAGGEHGVLVRAHVARSWISSFDETDPVLEFSETANVYSLRAEYTAPVEAQVPGRPLQWVLFAGYAGFFGANRDALGFSTVAEAGAGLQAPIGTEWAKSERLRVGASYLFGPDVHGWTVSVGLQY
jgi:hypothetical protein